MSASQLSINAAELLREPGLRRHVAVELAPADLDIAHESIAGDVRAQLDLVSTLDDIALTGTIEVPWHGTCRRCLQPIAETISVEVDERYAERPAEHDEAFPIDHGQIDLGPVLREHVLLAVGELRLCRPDCAGLCPVCGVDRNAAACACATDIGDERWAILDQLR
jgi:uncharacterized protein